MYSYRTHIRSVFDELVDNSIKSKATIIDSKIEVTDDTVTITVKDNGVGMPPDELEEVESMLKQPRRQELEEYYGSLTNVISTMGRGLAMVGMMTDEASIISDPVEGTKVRVTIKLTKTD